MNDPNPPQGAAGRLVGTLLAGKYRVNGLLGQGGMGAVYKAVQEALEREVAIKVILPDQASTSMARLRFRREARAVACLNHPGIAQVHEFGTTEDSAHYLVMEFVKGGSFATYQAKPPPLRELIEVADRILDALAYTHARHIYHRDLKPDNVLLHKDHWGQLWPKLVDFGIASVAEAEMKITQTGIALGTPRYMSPEQARGMRVGPPADLYALAVMLYEVIGGDVPFTGGSAYEVMQAKVSRAPPWLQPKDVYRDIPTGLIQVIMKGLETNPEHRFRLAAEFRRALAPFLAEGTGLPGIEEASDGLKTSEIRIPALAADGGIAKQQTTRVPQGGELPFVGREQEREAIERWVRDTVDTGKAHLVLVDGEAGIGKSRLVDWVRTRAEELGWMRSLRGAYSEAGAAYRDGLRGVLDDYLNVGGEGRAVTEAAIRNFLKNLGEDDPAEVSALLQYMRPTAITSTQFEGSDPSNEGHNFALLERTLRRIAADGPLLLFLDDIHWGGRQVFEFLKHLMLGLQLNPAPILVLATLRTDVQVDAVNRERAKLSRYQGEWLHLINLQSMTDAEGDALLEPFLPSREERVIVVKRAGGNPLFAIQLARMAEENTDGSQSLLGRALPQSLKNMLEAQLDRAIDLHADPHYLRSLLQRIALLGARIPMGLLEFTVKKEGGDPDQLLDDLDLLVANGVVRDVPGADGDLVEFGHGLMRDTLLEQVSGRRARRLHHRIAQIKEAWYGNRLLDSAAEVARHYREGGDLDAASRLMGQAVKHAVRGGKPAEAAALSREMATMLGDRPEVAGPAWLEAGRLFWELGEVADAVAALEQARNSGDQGARVGASILQARIDVAQKGANAGRQTLDQVRAVLETAPVNNEDELESLWVEWAQADAHVLEQEGYPNAAVSRLEELLGRGVDAAIEPSLQVRAGAAQLHCGRLDKARAHLLQALEKAQEQGQTEQEGWAQLYLHRVQVESDELEAAAGSLEAAQDVAKRVGARRLLAQVLSGQGQMARLRGESEQAEKAFRMQISINEDLGDEQARGEAMLELANLLGEQGKGDAALALMQEVSDLAERGGYRSTTAAVELHRAASLARVGRFSEAVVALERAQGMRESWDAQLSLITALETFAMATAQVVPDPVRRGALESAAELCDTLGRGAQGDWLRQQAGQMLGT